MKTKKTETIEMASVFFIFAFLYNRNEVCNMKSFTSEPKNKWHKFSGCNQKVCAIFFAYLIILFSGIPAVAHFEDLQRILWVHFLPE